MTVVDLPSLHPEMQRRGPIGREPGGLSDGRGSNAPNVNDPATPQ
jgi:hypothetical protein